MTQYRNSMMHRSACLP